MSIGSVGSFGSSGCWRVSCSGRRVPWSGVVLGPSLVTSLSGLHRGFPTSSWVESNTLCALDLFIQAGYVDSATGRSMYRYWDLELGGGTRAHKVHKLGDGTRAYKGCWQVGGTTGDLWRYSVPSWGVM